MLTAGVANLRPADGIQSVGNYTGTANDLIEREWKPVCSVSMNIQKIKYVITRLAANLKTRKSLT